MLQLGSGAINDSPLASISVQKLFCILEASSKSREWEEVEDSTYNIYLILFFTDIILTVNIILLSLLCPFIPAIPQQHHLQNHHENIISQEATIPLFILLHVSSTIEQVADDHQAHAPATQGTVHQEESSCGD